MTADEIISQSAEWIADRPHLANLTRAELAFVLTYLNYGSGRRGYTQAYRVAMGRPDSVDRADTQRQNSWRKGRPQIDRAIAAEREYRAKLADVHQTRIDQAREIEAFSNIAHIMDPETREIHADLDPEDWAPVEEVVYGPDGKLRRLKLADRERARQRLEATRQTVEEQKVITRPEVAVSFLPPGVKPSQFRVLQSDNVFHFVFSDKHRQWIEALGEKGDSPNEILYGGAKGSAKSAYLRDMLVLGCLVVPNLNCVLLRRTLPEIKRNHLKGARGFERMLAPWKQYVSINHGDFLIRFWNGAQIQLSGVQRDTDWGKFHGDEIHILAIDELTQQLKAVYEGLLIQQRVINIDYSGLKRLIPGVTLPLAMSATNPGQHGHLWVKERFLDGKEPGKTYHTSEEEGGKRRRFEPATYRDNPWLMEDDPGYPTRLKGHGNPAFVKAILDGDWSMIDGGMFSDIWDPAVHLIDPFRVPADWRVYQGHDDGDSSPFSSLWAAISNGSEVELPDGSRHTYAAGSVFVVAEWYGADKKGKGLNMRIADQAAGMKEREARMMEYHHFDRINTRIADTRLFNGEKSETDLAREFRRHGIKFVRAKKGPYSIASGLRLIAERLQGSLDPRAERPGLYLFRSIVPQNGLATLLPVAPRCESNPEVTPEGWPDHPLDALRYILVHIGKAAKTKALDDFYG